MYRMKLSTPPEMKLSYVRSTLVIIKKMAASRQVVVLGNLFGRLACRDTLRSGVVCTAQLNHQQTRQGSQKHYNPLYRRHRARKVANRPWLLRQLFKNTKDQTDDEIRIVRKKLGLPPINTFVENPINLTATSGFFDAYTPPEGDGKSSSLSIGSLSNTGSAANSKRKSLMATRKIKQYDPSFKQADFLAGVQEIYFEAQKLLEDFKANEEQIHDLVTLYAYEAMTNGLEMKTIRWKFIENVEAPKVVQVRCEQALTEENFFAQITVRFFTKQTLAVYDRFGRLMYGNEDLVKDCLEYVVFEKHAVDEYGKWRLHGKIVPDWMPQRAPLLKSYRKPEPSVKEDDEGSDLPETNIKDSETQEPPQLTTA